MAYKDREKAKEYNRTYMRNKRKSPEEREKARLKTQAYRDADPTRARVQCHQSGVRIRNREAYLSSDFTDVELYNWIKTNLGNPCPYCGEPNFHIDHKVPLTRGGTHTWDNIELVCADCNVAKRDRTPEEFLAHVLRIAKLHA